MGNAEYMGTPELSAVPTSDKQTQTMKVFVLLCVVAAAMADADPYLVYSGYGGLHHGYAAYPYTTYHYGKREAEAEAKPYYYGAYGYGGLYRPYSYGYGYGFPTTYHYGKRSAEAEPYYYGGYYGGYRAYRPYSYGYGRFGYY